MLLLFAGGVMNLTVIAALTAFFAFRKTGALWLARRANQTCVSGMDLCLPVEAEGSVPIRGQGGSRCVQSERMPNGSLNRFALGVMIAGSKFAFKCHCHVTATEVPWQRAFLSATAATNSLGW
jgi:hypothetical protein